MIGSILRIRYEITSLISEGKLFTAYTARDRLLARDVTIRTIAGPMNKETDFLASIDSVVQKMKATSHPNIEAMLSLDDHEGSPFLVSEWSKGALLGDRIKRFAPFSVPVAIGTVISILEGLEAIHAAGNAHGDIGSHTVTINNDGTARLQLAGIWESYSHSRYAGAAVLQQMAPYLAPEVSKGGPPSPCSDLYGVGILLFELLTARQPYQSESLQTLVQMHGSQPIPRLRSINPSIPQVMDYLLEKVLAKNPPDRYRSASELLSDLRIIQDALRFGKSLTWPLAGASASGKSIPASAEGTPSQRGNERVAGEAQQSQEHKARHRLWGKRTPQQEKGAPDVPWWIRLPLAMSFFAFAGCVGAFVFYNLNQAPHVRVPNVKNLSKNEASNSLLISKLKLGRVIMVESELIPRDKVVDQFPRGGDKVREGSTVTLRLSAGSRYAKVPDLSGHTQDEARTMLSEVGLSLDDKIQDAPSSKVERGKVIGQAPKPGSNVERTTLVRIQVSSGIPESMVAQQQEPPSPVAEVKPPEPSKAHLYTVKVKTTGLTQRAHVRVDMTDDYGTLSIFDEERDPDETFIIKHKGYGPEATFRIYYDDDLRYTFTRKASNKP